MGGLTELVQKAEESMELQKANVALSSRNKELEEKLEKFNNSPDLSNAPVINTTAVEKTFTLDELQKAQTENKTEDKTIKIKEDLAKADNGQQKEVLKQDVIFASMDKAFGQPIIFQQK